MAAISRATLRSTIRSRGDYTNVRRFPNEYLNAEIQTAFGHCWRVVDEAHQGWWDTENTVSTVAAQPYIALPADTKVVKGVDLIEGGETVELAQVGIAQRNRYSATPGRPCAYRLSARGAELYPTPNGVYTLRVIYTPKPPQLEEDTEREWYEGWEDYVIEKVLLELDSREGKPLQERFVKLDLAEKALRASTGARRQQEPEYLTLHEGGIDPFRTGEID